MGGAARAGAGTSTARLVLKEACSFAKRAEVELQFISDMQQPYYVSERGHTAMVADTALPLELAFRCVFVTLCCQDLQNDREYSARRGAELHRQARHTVESMIRSLNPG